MAETVKTSLLVISCDRDRRDDDSEKCASEFRLIVFPNH